MLNKILPMTGVEPLVSKATALPTEPQPLPRKIQLFTTRFAGCEVQQIRK